MHKLFILTAIFSKSICPLKPMMINVQQQMWSTSEDKLPSFLPASSCASSYALSMMCSISSCRIFLLRSHQLSIFGDEKRLNGIKLVVKLFFCKLAKQIRIIKNTGRFDNVFSPDAQYFVSVFHRHKLDSRKLGYMVCYELSEAKDFRFYISHFVKCSILYLQFLRFFSIR